MKNVDRRNFLDANITYPRGWNDPHIFVNNERISLTKDEARYMAVKFFEKKFKAKNVSLKFVRCFPYEKGMCRIRLCVAPGAKHQEFDIYFNNGETMIYSSLIEFSKKSSGVAHRELLSALYDWMIYGKKSAAVSLKEVPIEEFKETLNKMVTPEEASNQRDQSDNLEIEFPILIQRKYKLPCSFKNISNGQYSIMSLYCPTDNGIKLYMGTGFTKKEAKMKAILKAINDGVLT